MLNRMWICLASLATGCSTLAGTMASPAEIEVKAYCECWEKLRNATDGLQARLDECNKASTDLVNHAEAFRDKYGPVEGAKLVQLMQRCTPREFLE